MGTRAGFKAYNTKTDITVKTLKYHSANIIYFFITLYSIIPYVLYIILYIIRILVLYLLYVIE